MNTRPPENLNRLPTAEYGNVDVFVNPAYPFLGATPDGVIDDETLLEIKCPYKGRKSLIKPGALFPFLEYENNEVVLKESSKYYDQIQGQMLVCEAKICRLLCIHFKTFSFKKSNLMKIIVNLVCCPS